MIDPTDNLYKDFETVRQISVIPTMLEVICQTTEMGFAAIARVTQDRWLACSVRDELQFGLKTGEELKIDTTICNEVRNSLQPVVIDNVSEDPHYKSHHTLKIYGLQSYISVPIILKDGTFFGTLCAIDSKPAKVNNKKVIGTFTMFAELLSFHLESHKLLERSYEDNRALLHKNRILTDVNNDLDNFVYTASHDLKSPIANIEGLLDVLSNTVSQENLDRGKINKIIGLMVASLKRFSLNIKDLTTFVETNNFSSNEKNETVDFLDVIESVKLDLENPIVESKASIDVFCKNDPLIRFSKKNFKSILHNLISNAIKYRSPERFPEIQLTLGKVDKKVFLTVEDNGLGIPSDKLNDVFTMFKRFHNHVEGSGLGLYIVKRMVDNNKGQIKVESTLHEGTKFTITLPEQVA